MSFFAIDIQHRGKYPDSTSVNDRGAIAPSGLTEVEMTDLIGLVLDSHLRAAGHTVFYGPSGGYRERHSAVNMTAAEYYFALHMNAGGRGTDYGLVLYDYRSPRGKALAERIATALASVLNYRVSAAAARPDTNGQPRDADYTEAFNCISGVNAVALLFEFGFLDGSKMAAHVATRATALKYAEIIAPAIVAGFTAR
jgi:N-acetylmuramoyl-L-alanine amidase